MRENDWYIIRSILSILTTLGIIAAGVYDPRLLVLKILGKETVPANSVNLWIQTYMTHRKIKTRLTKASKYNVATCAIVEAESQEPASATLQEVHEQGEDDTGTPTEVEEADENDRKTVVHDSDAVVQIMAGGHTRAHLFDVSTLTDFVKYVSLFLGLVHCIVSLVMTRHTYVRCIQMKIL